VASGELPNSLVLTTTDVGSMRPCLLRLATRYVYKRVGKDIRWDVWRGTGMMMIVVPYAESLYPVIKIVSILRVMPTRRSLIYLTTIVFPGLALWAMIAAYLYETTMCTNYASVLPNNI